MNFIFGLFAFYPIGGILLYIVEVLVKDFKIPECTSYFLYVFMKDMEENIEKGFMVHGALWMLMIVAAVQSFW